MANRKLYPSEKQDRLIVRFPEGMRDKIGALARANGRSMNAEVISRLEASFDSPKAPLIEQNTAEAAIVWELKDSMQSLGARFDELLAVLKAGESTTHDVGSSGVECLEEDSSRPGVFDDLDGGVGGSGLPLNEKRHQMGLKFKKDGIGCVAVTVRHRENGGKHKAVGWAWLSKAQVAQLVAMLEK